MYLLCLLKASFHNITRKGKVFTLSKDLKPAWGVAYAQPGPHLAAGLYL